MKKAKTLTLDQKSEPVRQIEAKLGIDMLEKLPAAFTLLSEAMVHRACKKRKRSCGSGRTRDDRPAQRRALLRSGADLGEP
jgi:3-polyprenyl-4-hydroxybenzoate decarboxylase